MAAYGDRFEAGELEVAETNKTYQSQSACERKRRLRISLRLSHIDSGVNALLTI